MGVSVSSLIPRSLSSRAQRGTLVFARKVFKRFPSPGPKPVPVQTRCICAGLRSSWSGSRGGAKEREHVRVEAQGHLFLGSGPEDRMREKVRSLPWDIGTVDVFVAIASTRFQSVLDGVFLLFPFFMICLSQGQNTDGIVKAWRKSYRGATVLNHADPNPLLFAVVLLCVAPNSPLPRNGTRASGCWSSSSLRSIRKPL